jgi:hypothetical protein
MCSVFDGLRGARRSGPNVFHLAGLLPFQFGIVKSARVAESPGSIGTTSPFRRVDPVTAVAASRRRYSLA